MKKLPERKVGKLIRDTQKRKVGKIIRDGGDYMIGC